MGDLTGQSSRLIEEARRVRDDNRAGGRHRRAGLAGGRSIGAGSARLKARHYLRKLIRILLAVAAVLIAAIGVGIAIGGIGFAGIMLTVLAVIAVVVAFSAFPRIKVPTRAELNTGDVPQLVARTELWLEHQRAALPPPVARLLDDMGVQLDTLGQQLRTAAPDHPRTHDIRRLVGETLPDIVDSYKRIPPDLRRQKRGELTPDEQLAESLRRIGDEIGSINEQLAQGSLDDLAIRHRYLDYKFGDAADASAGQLEHQREQRPEQRDGEPG